MARNQGGEGSGQTKNTSPEAHEAARRAAKARRKHRRPSAQQSTGGLLEGLRSDAELRRLEAEKKKRLADIEFRKLQVRYALGALDLPDTDSDKELVSVALVAFIDVEVPEGMGRTKAAINKALRALERDSISPKAHQTVYHTLAIGYNKADASKRQTVAA